MASPRDPVKRDELYFALLQKTRGQKKLGAVKPENHWTMSVWRMVEGE
jgi:hypothetical protein